MWNRSSWLFQRVPLLGRRSSPAVLEARIVWKVSRRWRSSSWIWSRSSAGNAAAALGAFSVGLRHVDARSVEDDRPSVGRPARRGEEVDEEGGESVGLFFHD